MHLKRYDLNATHKSIQKRFSKFFLGMFQSSADLYANTIESKDVIKKIIDIRKYYIGYTTP